LGCEVSQKGSIKCNEDGLTSVPGVYVAGDASRDVQLAVVAAAEGAQAAIAINKELLERDFGPEPTKVLPSPVAGRW
jgi:thioredoxin reductase